MKECMLCDREHEKLFGNAIKYCEYCKSDYNASVVNEMINNRREEIN